MRKQTLALFLVFSIILSLAGCGSKAPVSPSPATPGTTGGTDAQTPPVNAPSTPNTPGTTPPTDGPALLLPRLERAYNNRDLYAMSECYDPSGARAVFGLLKLLGMPADAMCDILPFFSYVLGSSGALDSSDWGTVTLTALAQTINGVDATLTYNVSLKMKDGSTNSFDETASCVLVDGEWYFALNQGAAPSVPVEIGLIPVADGLSAADVEYLYSFSDGSVGLLNQSAKVVIAPYFEETGSLEYQYIPVKKAGSWGLIDRMGNLVVDYQFQAVIPCRAESDGAEYYMVEYNDKWGVYDPKAITVIPCLYDAIGEINGGVFPVKQDGLWGAVDNAGEPVIPFKYDELGRFNDGVIPAKLNGFWGVIDGNGSEKVPFMYDKVSGGEGCGAAFSHGMLGVYYNGNLGVIDTNGTYVVPFGVLCMSGGDINVVLVSIKDDYMVIGKKYLYSSGPPADQRVYIFSSNKFIELVDIAANPDYYFVCEVDGIFYYSLNDISGGLMAGVTDAGNLVIDLRVSAEKSLSRIQDFTHIRSISSKEILDGVMIVQAAVGRQWDFLISLYYYNIVGPGGKLLLENWVQYEPSAQDGIIWVYDEVTRKTMLFSYSGELVVSVDGLYNWVDSYGGLAQIGSKGIDYINFRTGAHKNISASITSIDSAGATEQCAVLYDGVFYGLFVSTGEGELVGSGMCYHDIS